MVPRVSIAFLAAWGCMATDVKVIEEIAAKVNGDIITRGDLEKMWQGFEEDA
jgi:hypothetical protein